MAINYYGIVGKNDLFQDETGELKPANNWVEMKESRPTLEHVATATGEWILPTTELVESN